MNNTLVVYELYSSSYVLCPAQYLILGGGYSGKCRFIFRILKNMSHQVFLAQFQYMDHPQSIAFLQQCCPKELDNKGKAKLPTKNIVTPTFIQVRLGSKYPNISAFFNCYFIIPIYLNHLNFYCSQITLNSSLRSPILSIKFNYIY